MAGIEVKASSGLNEHSFKNLALLRDHVGDNFQCGIIFYTGTNTLSFGERLFAVPISALWETASKAALPLTYFLLEINQQMVTIQPIPRGAKERHHRVANKEC